MFLRRTWPAFSWALFILIICGVPGRDIPKLSFLEWLQPDKIVHLGVYAVLCFLFIKGFSAQDQYHSLKISARLWSVIICVLYGCLIEVLQSYVFIERSGDVRDAIANSIGTLIGLWIYNRWMKYRKNTRTAGNLS